MRLAIIYNLVDSIEKGLEVEKLSDNDIVDTVAYVATSLEREHEVVALRMSPSLVGRLAACRPDFVFNLCEGIGGNVFGESHFAGFLDTLGIPYTGNNAFTLALCLDKVRAKQVLIANGITTPEYQVFTAADEPLRSSLRFPLIVKPRNEDASVGIFNDSVVHDEAALRRKVRHILATYHQPALVEEYIDGRELNVALLGNGADLKVLPISEIVFDVPEGMPRIVSYEAKWLDDTPMFKGTTRVCPSPLPDAIAQKVRAVAMAAFAAMGCRDYARVDIRLRGETPFVLEVNPNPGIDKECGFVRSAVAAGYGEADVVRAILASAQRRHQDAVPPVRAAGEDPVRMRIAALYASPHILESERLVAVPERLEHVPLLTRWFNDPETIRFMDDPEERSTEDEVLERHFLRDDCEVDLVITLRGTGIPIGFAYIYDFDPSNSSATLSFAIGEKEHRGRGYGNEILGILRTAAFEGLGLNSLFASVVTENAASIAVLERSGFRRIGLRRESHRLGGRYMDEVLLDMTLSDHLSLREGREGIAQPTGPRPRRARRPLPASTPPDARRTRGG